LILRGPGKISQVRIFDPFHNLVRLFPGLFWGQPIDSAAVFVNKINNLATQSWKKILAFASIENIIT
jgi:hypothetical protein